MTLRILSIGAGNVAFHLMQALKASGNEIIQVYSRKTSNAKSLADKLNCSYTNKASNLDLDCDLIIVSLPDQLIPNVVDRFKLKSFKGIIAHTSGSTASINSNVKYSGVFYPLQTFNKTRDVVLSNVPFFITGNNHRTKQTLRKLSKQISERVYTISDEKRRELHLAAVILNNFIHHLAYRSEEYLKSKKLKFEYLDELLKTGFEKILEKRLKSTQTGPAKRADLETIKTHKDMLESDIALSQLYDSLTNSILKTYGHK